MQDAGWRMQDETGLLTTFAIRHPASRLRFSAACLEP
jgi:hypothetical protein